MSVYIKQLQFGSKIIGTLQSIFFFDLQNLPSPAPSNQT